MQSKHVVISVNPKAGRVSPLKRTEQLRQALCRMGFQPEIYDDLAQATRRANKLFQGGTLRVLVGVGGDGTASELTNRTVPGVPITLLPSGTANLIAKYLKLPFNPLKTAEMIATGKLLNLDAAKANNRLFLLMLSVGIDAEVVKKVHSRREQKASPPKGSHINYLSYLSPIFQVIRTYRYPSVSIRFHGSSNTQTLNEGTWFIISNLPLYGWGFSFIPTSFRKNGEVSFCLLRNAKLFKTLITFILAQFGKTHRFLPEVILGNDSRFHIDNVGVPTEPITYQLDGDPGGYLPVDVEVLPNRFTVLVPSTVTPSKIKRNKQTLSDEGNE